MLSHQGSFHHGGWQGNEGSFYDDFNAFTGDTVENRPYFLLLLYVSFRMVMTNMFIISFMLFMRTEWDANMHYIDKMQISKKLTCQQMEAKSFIKIDILMKKNLAGDLRLYSMGMAEIGG